MVGAYPKDSMLVVLSIERSVFIPTISPALVHKRKYWESFVYTDGTHSESM